MTHALMRARPPAADRPTATGAIGSAPQSPGCPSSTDTCDLVFGFPVGQSCAAAARFSSGDVARSPEPVDALTLTAGATALALLATSSYSLVQILSDAVEMPRPASATAERDGTARASSQENRAVEDPEPIAPELAPRRPLPAESLAATESPPAPPVASPSVADPAIADSAIANSTVTPPAATPPTPDAITPDPTISDAITPDAITPDATISDATTPDATVPQVAASQETSARIPSALPDVIPEAGSESGNSPMETPRDSPVETRSPSETLSDRDRAESEIFPEKRFAISPSEPGSGVGLVEAADRQAAAGDFATALYLLDRVTATAPAARLAETRRSTYRAQLLAQSDRWLAAATQRAEAGDLAGARLLLLQIPPASPRHREARDRLDAYARIEAQQARERFQEAVRLAEAGQVEAAIARLGEVPLGTPAQTAAALEAQRYRQQQEFAP